MTPSNKNQSWSKLNKKAPNNKFDIYKIIKAEWRAIVETSQMPWESRLATLVALIKNHNPTVSWVGAYLVHETTKKIGIGSHSQTATKDQSLWVHCYQGPVACTQIPPGKGVCGQSFSKEQIFIVPDVEKFPGHIVCDSKSRSEIVLPLYREHQLVGVLDLDSHTLAAFDEVDAQSLTELLNEL